MIGGALLGVTLSGLGGALLWIARGQDDRAVTSRKRLAGIAALAGGGVFFGVVGVAMRATGDPEGTFVGLVAATAVAAAARWWIATRDSRLADSVQAPVQLGDGRLEPGTVVTMPRSKRVALAIGALLMGSVFLAVVPAMLADGDWRAWLMAAAGAFTLLVGGRCWRSPRSARPAWRSPPRRAGRRGLDARGWSICFPQTVFDLHIEDVVAMVNEAHPRQETH